MPKIPLGNLTRLGLVQDVSAQALALGAWNEMRNVRLINGRAEKFKGHSQIYGDLLHAPYGLLYVNDQVKQAWILMGLTNVSAYVDGGHVDINPVGVSFGATPDLGWNADLFFNLPVLNNGIDVPHIWTEINGGVKLAPLPNWPATWRARIIRPFKNYLIALDLTDNGVRYPHLLSNSHPAAPGEVPISWDYADPTKDASRVDIGEGVGGKLVDGLSLGNSFIVYKERSVWEMVTTGNATFPLALDRLFIGEAGMGLLSKGCVTAIREGTFHFVVGSEFIYIHDGRQHDRISVNRIESQLFKDINPSTIQRSFVTTNIENREVWFCYPEVGEDWPTKALVWNWQEGQFYPRDLAPAATIQSGAILAEGAEQALFWDAADMDGDWADWEGTWYTIRHQPGERKLIQADPINSKLYYMDDGITFDGEPIEAWMRRDYMPFTRESTQDRLRAEKGDRLQLTETWPQAAKGTISIQVGSSQKIDGPITWSQKKTFNPVTQQSLPFYITGVELSLRIELNDPEAQFWGLSAVVDVTGISI